MSNKLIHVDFKTKAIKKRKHKSKFIFYLQNLLAEKNSLEKNISPRLKIYNYRSPL